ncbi:MAG: di-heme oxidoredictase family protein [Rhizobacter sp.]
MPQVRKMIQTSRKIVLLAVLAMSAFTCVAAEIYDGPAIDVFPDHEKIGKTYSIKKAVSDGKRLFVAKFNLLDGSGRPFATEHNFPTARSDAGPSFQRIAGPDANSCAGCHNQPAIGGSGDFAVNVFAGAPQFGAQLTDSISAVFSNERNTRSLVGIGGIEIAATEMSRELIRQKDDASHRAKQSGQPIPIKLATKGVSFGSIVARPDGDVDFSGLQGISPDLVVRPFNAKGTVTSIREFTIVALNQHHGIEATEFFGKARTGSKDFDGDGVEDEFSVGQTTALSLFQAAIPAPDNRNFEKHRGFAVFKQVGCDSCHLPAMRVNTNLFSEPNEFNREGVLAPGDSKNHIKMPLPLMREGKGFVLSAYTDLKRHVMCDSKRKQLCNELKKQDKVPFNEFMTTRLWDLSTSAPYCHRGDCTTLTEAIEVHGGEASDSTEKFDALSRNDKVALIQFLKLLGSREEVH